jgi:DNA-binding GntR family transcriptional regulator
MTSPLTRAPLRDHICEIVREQIVRGELPPGAPVRDTDLAESLGASRTPVREALIRLTAEGLLESLVGRGFRVRALRRQDVEDVYPLLWTLEPLALGDAPAFTEEQSAELERITLRMEDQSAGASERHELDASWHRCLISGCANARLVRIIEKLRDTSRRYELAYLGGAQGMELSVAEHREISQAFAAGDRAHATEQLREHWQRGRGELLSFLPEKTEA